MTGLYRGAINILSASCWMAFEAAVILGLALVLIHFMGLEQAGLETQAGIVVAIAVAGGVALEILRHRFQGRKQITIGE